MNRGMYTLKLSGQFKKSYKRCLKRGLDMALFQEVVDLLVKGITLVLESFIDRELSGMDGMSHSTGLVIDLEI